MRILWLGGLLLVVTAGGQAAEPAGRLVRETWDAAFLDGEKAGHFHTTVIEYSTPKGTFLRVSRELRLTVKRFGDVATIRAEVGNDETADGKLLGAFLTQQLGTNLFQKLSGRVVEGVMRSTIEGRAVQGGRVDREIPLPEDLLTLLGEEALLKQKKPKPGERLSYRLFDPAVNNVIRVQVVVKGYEQVPLDGANRRLLRVVATPDKIQQVQLPPQTIWYDEEFVPVLSQAEMPGMGELTLRRTTREKATAPAGKLRDLGEQSVVLDRPIANPHGQAKVVYRVTFSRRYETPQAEADALKELSRVAFAVDGVRQTVTNVQGRTLELHIAAVRTPRPVANAEPVAEEFRKSNFFITSEDEEVQRLAAQAAGHIQDPWRKAQAIERYVHRTMKGVAFTESMSPASHVAKTLRGDCTEFAMLTAAMCRAQGIPSRTAIGLVYYTDRSAAKLGYHMWTEVNVAGQWLGIDATLGLGSTGPGHVKVTDHSWAGEHSMVPLLPLTRLMMARPRMDVLQVE